MKTGKKLMLALVLLCIAAVGAVLLILPHRQQNDGWTVMVYMVGSDLESRYGLLTKDLEEMRSAVREDTRLIVMMGGLVVTSPLAKILHNSTTHRLMRKMETYRNVYVFSVPYVIQ